MRDFELSETQRQTREKALVGLGAAAAIECPYCSHFHREEAKLEGYDDEALEEAIDVTSGVKYFSTVLHGAEVDLEEFRGETAAIMDHVKQQQAATGDD